MGAAFADRGNDRPIVAIVGDGGFQMTACDLSTAVAHKLPIKIAIMDNNYLGMVRQWQELFFDGKYSHTVLKDINPDFVKLAESHGAVGLRASTPDEMNEVLKKAMQINGCPVVMDFIVEAEENCYPMVPAGAALNEMVEG
jgi:acetolactate synthase-1/2/3 large subunit